jgi:hypothetical protein
MVDKSSHFEYLVTYVDDILIWSKDSVAVIKLLEKTYMLKSVGIPEYYLGGNVQFLGEGEAWKNQGLELALSAKTYIQNIIPKFEGLFGKEFKPIKTPMSEGYHPEVDDSPLCTEDDSDNYRSGCCIWIIVLDRFDIAYATSAMSRFNMLPREGHLKAVKRILSYLKTFPKGRVIIDASYPDHSMYPVEEHSN